MRLIAFKQKVFWKFSMRFFKVFDAYKLNRNKKLNNQISSIRLQKKVNVTSTLPTVAHRYWPLPNLTVTCVTSVKSVTSVTDRNKGPFEQIFKVL